MHLVEVEDGDSLVECLRCEYVCQNFLKSPVTEVWNHRNRTKYLKNVLTGEIVSEPVAYD